MTTIGTRARVMTAALGCFALAAFGPVSPAAAKAGVKIRQALGATQADPDAQGKVRFELRGTSDGRLVLAVKKLARNTSYEVLSGGVKVGTITTGGGGGGRIRFRSRPKSGDHMLGFDPRGATLTVRSSGGDDVLTGTIVDDSSSPGDPGDVVCCVPDDSGPECEDRTPAECAAQGGSVSDAASCLPNPCAGAPAPSLEVVCCIPDDSGPECEDRTVADCAAQGGTVIDAPSCIANPCAPTPQG